MGSPAVVATDSRPVRVAIDFFCYTWYRYVSTLSELHLQQKNTLSQTYKDRLHVHICSALALRFGRECYLVLYVFVGEPPGQMALRGEFPTTSSQSTTAVETRTEGAVSECRAVIAGCCIFLSAEFTIITDSSLLRKWRPP